MKWPEVQGQCSVAGRTQNYVFSSLLLLFLNANIGKTQGGGRKEERS